MTPEPQSAARRELLTLRTELARLQASHGDLIDERAGMMAQARTLRTELAEMAQRHLQTFNELEQTRKSDQDYIDRQDAEIIRLENERAEAIGLNKIACDISRNKQVQLDKLREDYFAVTKQRDEAMDRSRTWQEIIFEKESALAEMTKQRVALAVEFNKFASGEMYRDAMKALDERIAERDEALAQLEVVVESFNVRLREREKSRDAAQAQADALKTQLAQVAGYGGASVLLQLDEARQQAGALRKERDEAEARVTQLADIGTDRGAENHALRQRVTELETLLRLCRDAIMDEQPKLHAGAALAATPQREEPRNAAP